MTSNSTNPPSSNSNVTEPRQPLRKKPRLSAPSSRTSTPNAYARRSPPRESQSRTQAPRSPSPRRSRSRSRSPSRSPPRKLKRPGAGARLHASDRAAAAASIQRRHEAEAQQNAQQQDAQDNKGRAVDLVASHYNAVPQRGRTWRKSESEIKGLRSLNNWVKSTLIQKFGAAQDTAGAPLLVLDVACGKGGDLGKWEKALRGRGGGGLYVGCDVADISVQQARERWGESLRRGGGGRRGGDGGGAGDMQAEFYVLDAFSRSLAEIPRVRQVGFNPHAGPGGGVIQGGMMSGGFDVVSMMFALHYSYESEVLARGMLANVSGALKKGGRFIGVMPDSDVISGMVKKLLGGEKKVPDGKKSELKEGEEEGEIMEEGEVEEDEDDWDPEKPSEPHTNGAGAATGQEDDEDEWDPEKPSEPQPSTTNGTASTPAAAKEASADEEEDTWDPEKPSEAPPPTTNTDIQTPNPPLTSPPTSTSTLPPLEWGNTLHTIRFPRNQTLTKLPLPQDGIFRPPYGWRYHYHLAEAVDVPEYVVPWEAFRALAADYGLELMYRKGFREVLFDETAEEGELRVLAERMGVLRRGGGLEVREVEMEVAGFYHAFCFYKT